MQIKLLFLEENEDRIEEVVIDNFTEIWTNDLDGSFTVKGEIKKPSQYVKKWDHEGFLTADSSKFYGVKVVDNE